MQFAYRQLALVIQILGLLMFRAGFQSAGVGLDLFLPEKQLLDEVFFLVMTRMAGVGRI